MTLAVANIVILTAWLVAEVVPLIADELARRDIERADKED
jgi:hypothetical protein